MTISNDKTRYSLTLKKAMKESLEKKAVEESRSLNNLIETILEEYLKKN
ncbi:DNA-binding protein [Bacillus wiedmannii]|nr:DNA-binding protein [Bacillus wiedmannii]PEJ40071.1 DNA-binding protein [Bacillus wiedmannii]